MRSMRLTIVFVVLIFTLFACSKETELEYVSEVKLTDREKFLLSSTSDYSFVFDFQNDNKKYKQIALWVDKYEFGKLTEEKINHLTTEIEESGTIVFTASKLIGSQINSTFNISVGTDSSTSGVSTDQVMPKMDQSTWGSNSQKSIPLSENMALASIAYANGNGMSSLSTDFYNDVESHLDEIKAYDVVYILKSKFQ
ncbi:hypothetical protein [Bacillus sp. FJAT-22090]|uniref:hypothetical protein n=1 Tax=Bacillus sp. FJAT-22090 TaxID=1581038 RepID=UPI00119F499B|nr:hypothetical protein [Bacillus sp. FJAT-22090]